MNEQPPGRVRPPRIAAAALESRSSDRLLLVVADSRADLIDVKLMDGELVAQGSGPFQLRFAERGSVTALARVTMESAACGASRRPPADVNLAVTWAVAPGRGRPTLDVAGTAYVFEPGALRPEEFRAKRHDPFNTVDLPGLSDDPESSEAPAPVPVVEPQRRRRGRIGPWAPPTHLNFPPRGRRTAWAFGRI